MGKLFVIEGVDGAGKATQTKKLFDRLSDEGRDPLMVSFPDYDSKSSDIVKMYLAGDFGKNASDVDAKTASTFFAIDRYVSYKTKWGADYESGRLVIADRYTTSNMVHQASKIDSDSEKEEFLDWLCDYEYGIYKLPKPDLTLFLDMPPEYGYKLTRDRANKITGDMVQDIHEKDRAYIKKSYDNALFVAKKLGWDIIECVRNGEIRTIEDIADEIYAKAEKYI